jgi:hemoglobin-like flavoprotein
MYKSASRLLPSLLRNINRRPLHIAPQRTPKNIKVMTTIIEGKTIEIATCPVSGHKAAGQSCPFSITSKASAQLNSDPVSAIPPNFRNITLSAEQKELVKASIPALEAHGVDITNSFYQHLIKANPSLNNIFNVVNQDTLEQPKALANAVYAYAANIDNLTPLAGVVELIANKHASMYVRPEHYDLVGTHLLQAIQRILGDAVTPELLSAWEAAYWQLAKIFILREDQLYHERPEAVDWMDFRVAKKEVESEEVTSFYLEPISESHKPLPHFLPGQVSNILIQNMYRANKFISTSPFEWMYQLLVTNKLANTLSAMHPTRTIIE